MSIDAIARHQQSSRMAMLAFHGAQGSGKTTLSKAVVKAFNHQSFTQLHMRNQNNIADLALSVEQDPLRKKRLYQTWLEDTIYPELSAWLSIHRVYEDQPLPAELIECLSWERLGQEQSGVKLVHILTNLTECFQSMVKKVKAIKSRNFDELKPTLLIINARCNQSQSATQRWQTWLEQQSSSGRASIRLNIPLTLLRERIRQRGREGDERLVGEPVERTLRQVMSLGQIDAELDARLPIQSLVEQCLPVAQLAIDRVTEREQLS